jgi:uncharacterized protein YndB with AHSA1/START domain
MNLAAALADFGEVIEPNTLRIQRRLPGPAERVWEYLIDSDKRRQWLAAGDMDLRQGAQFALVWRNDELENAGQRPEGFDAEHRIESVITEIEPPHKLSYTFGNAGEVTFELERAGDDVLLTLTHRRLPGREMMTKVAAGWHAHLDVLDAKLAGTSPKPFWENMASLRSEYEQRLPA